MQNIDVRGQEGQDAEKEGREEEQTCGGKYKRRELVNDAKKSEGKMLKIEKNKRLEMIGGRGMLQRQRS